MMLRITVNDDHLRQRPRRSVSLPFHRPPLIYFSRRKSISYSQLPEEPIKLSVLRLDDSAFDIVVGRSATISELKLAVEAAFSHMPKTGPGKISWSHVWGHFCLCYQAQKLVTDTDSIIHYGIKDGDQLHFIRHISITYNMEKLRKLAAPKETDDHEKLVDTIIIRADEDHDEACMGPGYEDDFEDLERGKWQALEIEDHNNKLAIRGRSASSSRKRFFLFFRMLLRLV